MYAGTPLTVSPLPVHASVLSQASRGKELPALSSLWRRAAAVSADHRCMHATGSLGWLRLPPVGFGWCVWGAHVVHPWYMYVWFTCNTTWFTYDAPIMHPWCICTELWFTYDAHVIRVWCTCNAPMVHMHWTMIHVWCTRDTRMKHPWCTSD